MEVLYRVCCGLDVHKKTVAACLRSAGPAATRAEEIRTFGTTTRELLRFADWLTGAGCTHVAMESTGVYGRPVVHVSWRGMLKTLIAGERDPEVLAALAEGRLRWKTAQLREALFGRIAAHHVFMLDRLLNHVEYLENQIAAFDRQIEAATSRWRRRCSASTRSRGWDDAALNRSWPNSVTTCAASRRPPMPRRGPASAPAITRARASAGREKPGRATSGFEPRWSSAPRGAVRARKTYLSAQYHRLARRRGDKKAIVAVGHSILVAAWHVLRDGQDYRELGTDYFDRLERQRLIRYHTRRLAELSAPPKAESEPATS
jgi:transposase